MYFFFFFFEKEIYFVLLLRMCGTTKYKFVLFLQIKLIVYYISKTYQQCDKCGPQLLYESDFFFFFWNGKPCDKCGPQLVKWIWKTIYGCQWIQKCGPHFWIYKDVNFFLVQIFLIIIEKQTSQVSVICLFNFIITLPKC